MSEPTRYRVANNQAQLTLGGNILAVDPAGPLVIYADYARLKAEVERLTKAGMPLLAKPSVLNTTIIGRSMRRSKMFALMKSKRGTKPRRASSRERTEAIPARGSMR